MKNLKNIFTMALVTTCMSACTGFLDIEPETTLTGKNFIHYVFSYRGVALRWHFLKNFSTLVLYEYLTC